MEAKLLQETKRVVAYRAQQLNELPSVVDCEMAGGYAPSCVEPGYEWVGDPRFRVYAEESADGYIRQLVKLVSEQLVEDVSTTYVQAGNGRLPSEDVVWQSYLRWQKTAQQTFYFDTDFSQVTLAMVFAWVKRQLFHLHHLGAQPVQVQPRLLTSHKDASLNMRYAAFFLLALVLEKMRF